MNNNKFTRGECNMKTKFNTLQHIGHNNIVDYCTHIGILKGWSMAIVILMIPEHK